jgi:hypothetical protein
MKGSPVTIKGGLMVRVPIGCKGPVEIGEFTQAFTARVRTWALRLLHHRLMMTICIEMLLSSLASLDRQAHVAAVLGSCEHIHDV